MLNRTFLSAGLLTVISVASADVSNDSARMAIQGAIATGGYLSIGIARYAPKTEMGISISGSVNNATNETQTFTPIVFAGLVKELGERTYFTYGVNFSDTIGHLYGLPINAYYQVGPYISLEQMLTTHLMLSGWINPYQYGYQKLGGVAISTNGIFSAGGIALNYLF